MAFFSFKLTANQTVITEEIHAPGPLTAITPPGKLQPDEVEGEGLILMEVGPVKLPGPGFFRSVSRTRPEQR